MSSLPRPLCQGVSKRRGEREEERRRGVRSESKDREVSRGVKGGGRGGRGCRESREDTLGGFSGVEGRKAPQAFPGAERSSQYVVTWWLTLP